jgi:hypothetical protein
VSEKPISVQTANYVTSQNPDPDLPLVVDKSIPSISKCFQVFPDFSAAIASITQSEVLSPAAGKDVANW